jgi:ATP-dependent exoDNAse (exonuclease V) beta subunit
MTLPRLTVIPAGAGSGKTYTLQQQLGEWVAAGLVAPERIVAVTFTEAAAAELKSRIGARLLGLDRKDLPDSVAPVELALRLEEAYVSTIHGFGLRILTEFAFESGSSPQPRLLNEDEQNALIRLALARTTATDAITENLAAYGYAYDFNTKKSAEDGFRDDVLEIIGLLRATGWQAYSDGYARQAAEWIAERYGPVEDAAQLSAALRKSVVALLDRFPESLAGRFPDNKSATDALQKDFRNLRAAAEGEALDRDWALWQGLRTLRPSKRGAALPAPYDDLAAAVMARAAALPMHPGPLAHAQRHIEALLAAGQEVLVQYETAKREAGLVDYSDMIALAAQLLRQRPEVLETLKGRVDCLVVDEFQHTNPLQFELLWQLAVAGVPTVVVGDLKQAIMGFQGADPRLFEALAQQHPDECKPLVKNWRSQPALMGFVNALGPQLFGAEYIALAPQRKDTEPVPLEVVSFPAKAKKGQARVRAFAVGRRLQTLLKDPAARIEDRHTKQVRQLRGADLAVLCPTHSMIAEYAEVLRALGLKVRVRADGWYASRAVQVACNALSYLANRSDRHAALYLAVTELGSLTLKGALAQLMEGGRIAEPLLTRLDALAEGVSERTIYALVADTIAALGLFDTVVQWPDGEQQRANLLRLLAEAGEFMDANREALAYGGFHGGGVQTFLAWLAARVELKDGDQQPEPRVLDEDAIELSTWHAAKGREWPVVAVCGLDREVKATVPDLRLGYRSFEDLSRLLDLARIEYAPAFAAPETEARFLEELEPVAQREARRLLYVALTRARDKLLLEWPVYLAGKDKVSSWSILAEECQVSLTKDALTVGSKKFPCAVVTGGTELPEDLELGSVPTVSELPVIGRRAIEPGEAPTGLTPDSRTPSALAIEAPAAASADATVVTYGAPLSMEVGLTGVALGTFLHRTFEVLGARPDLAATLPAITGVTVSDADLHKIAAAVARFEGWVAETLKPASVQREWPLLHVDSAGTVVSGMADLIVHTAQGAWIVDHKSDVVEDPVAAFLKYEGQLRAYAEALAAAATPVAGVAVHWIRRGEVVVKRFMEGNGRHFA